ncbi:transporter substrate-binding domain-containing protein [Aquimarina sp. 2201CG1-2-11]|uniref:response regulator n=1 Tax=Aquimarina discodermiae TaxID=3231043 RepID=UPI0034631D7D
MSETEIKWLKENDSISIALFPYYPPYQFINKNDEIEGIFIDYLDLIEEKIDHRFARKHYSDWSKVLSDLKTKKTDMILEAQYTLTRSKYLSFHDPLFDTPYVIVSSDKTPFGLKLEDLTNKTVAIPLGYPPDDFLREKYPKIKIQTYVNEIESIEQVQKGEEYAYIGPRTVANYLINSKNLPNLNVVGESRYSYAPGIAVNKEAKILNKIITKALKNISNAEKQDVVENWLYVKTVPLYRKVNFFIPIVIFFLLLLIIIVDVNFYLGHIVMQKTNALKQAIDLAENDNRLKTAFINNISNEIKTPINNILLFSKHLKKEKITTNEKITYTEIIINSCKRLIDNMDNTLEISKLQTKQVKLYLAAVDILKLLDTIFSTYRIIAKKKGIELIVHNTIEEDQGVMMIDEAKFTKTINALIENAITFTNQGAVMITVMIKNNSAMISVRDSGIGIDPKEHKNIFKSFSKAEDQISKVYQGLGLGLTIALENTKMMGGNLSFSSILDKGSTFRLELPYQPVKRKITDNSKPDSKNIIDKHYMILIAEDGDVNFLVLKTILVKMEEYNFIIQRAKNGKEAVSFCEENNVDLILMDIKMPIMNGYDATKKIKEMYPNLPVIAQTAYTSKTDVKNAYKAGCDDFISKPVNLKSLKRIINKYLLLKVS